MILQICPGTKSYDIVIERGCLKKAGALLPLQRKVLIVTDSGVPERYASSLAAACDSMRHDKKSRGGRITVIETDRIGSYRMREADDAQLREKAAMVVK